MVLKMSAVQRRLIKKTEEVTAREVELRDLERVNKELKTRLARRPGPDVGEQLSRSRDTVKARNRQLQARLIFIDQLNPVHTIQPVVKPAEQLVALCKQTFNQSFNRFDNQLYRVNGVLELQNG